MREETIYTAVTDSTVTLYWRRPWNFGIKDLFEIHCAADHTVCRTSKTHCTARNLESGEWYDFEVRWMRGEECMWKTLVSVQTGRKKRRIDITEEPYFAKGDGRTDNTEAIQQAVNDCGPEEEVYIPQGTFLAGALELHTDMALYLEEGAVLLGSDKESDYLPMQPSRFEGIERNCYRILLNIGRMDHSEGYTCKDVLIYGKGTICGGGKKLAESMMDAERERQKDRIAALGDRIREYENENTIPGRARGRLIQICNCENVRISGLTLKDGPCWNVHMIYSRNILTDHCRIISEGIWNGDGWDPDSSEQCAVFACVFRTGDDAVAVKSGKNPEGNRIARPRSSINIFDCRIEEGHGIAIGSEISGGISGVGIWDCDLSASRYGIEVKGTKKRGGYVRNVDVQNCITPGICVHSVTYNDDGEPAGCPPEYSGLRFQDIEISENIHSGKKHREKNKQEK